MCLWCSYHLNGLLIQTINITFWYFLLPVPYHPLNEGSRANSEEEKLYCNWQSFKPAVSSPITYQMIILSLPRRLEVFFSWTQKQYVMQLQFLFYFWIHLYPMKWTHPLKRTHATHVFCKMFYNVYMHHMIVVSYQNLHYICRLFRYQVCMYRI